MIAANTAQLGRGVLKKLQDHICLLFILVFGLEAWFFVWITPPPPASLIHVRSGGCELFQLFAFAANFF
jgi:hypothetical protein